VREKDLNESIIQLLHEGRFLTFIEAASNAIISGPWTAMGLPIQQSIWFRLIYTWF